MVKFGGGISAVRALPKAKGKRPGGNYSARTLRYRSAYQRSDGEIGALRLRRRAGSVHRFTRRPQGAAAWRKQRVDLTDDGALADLNAAIDYLKG